MAEWSVLAECSPPPFPSELMPNSKGLWAQVACIWEVTARKPGNVHPYRNAGDSQYLDFLVAAAATAPVLAKAVELDVGTTVLEAVRATRLAVKTNVNLGIVLLLAPLSTVPLDRDLRTGVETVLSKLDVRDSQKVFEAIRLANPSGLGTVEREDVNAEPTLPLREVMALAAERDLIARQYANGFREVFDIGVPALERGLDRPGTLEKAIIFCQLTLLSQYPDSLIARKAGNAEAASVSQAAADVLASDWQATRGKERLREFDDWLRRNGNRLNPGTTADLVAASLFVALRQGILKVPLTIPWSTDPCYG